MNDVSTHHMSGAKGTRTPNPLLAKQVRYQLRHGPRSRCTISMDGTAESLLRNGTYQMARDIRRDHDQQCVQRDGFATSRRRSPAHLFLD